MVKRLFVGLFLGAVIGGLLAVALVQGLGVTSFSASPFGALGAYVAAAITGVLTGLVAGKPIWSADGKIEAGLKAFFGALLALGAMFALRTWVHLNLDLTALKASVGSQPIGELPAAALPAIAAVLAAFYELDNTDAPASDKAAPAVVSKASSASVRVAADADADVDADDEAKPLAKSRR
jgi:hypothetical protein